MTTPDAMKHEFSKLTTGITDRIGDIFDQWLKEFIVENKIDTSDGVSEESTHRVYVAPQGYLPYRPGAGVDEVISAGEFRRMGLVLPDDIPDCAVIPAAAIYCKISSDSSSPSGAFGIMNIDVRLLDSFTWVKLEITAEKKGS